MITKTTLRLAILILLIAGLAIPAGAKRAKVFMASPAPCYSPEGNVLSYATNVLGMEQVVRLLIVLREQPRNEL